MTSYQVLLPYVKKLRRTKCSEKYRMKMEKNETCSDNIYLSENDQSFIQAVFLPLLMSLAGLIVVAAMCGLLAWWKKIYRAVAIMSLEMIAKLAFIPDVKYKFEKRSPEKFEENLQDPSSSRKDEETGKTPNTEKFFEKSVFFTVSSDCSREKYWMHPCFATYMFANGMLPHSSIHQCVRNKSVGTH